MTFLEQLQTHRGGLLELKTQLFWYGRGWDSTPGRLCLLLDAAMWGRFSGSTEGIIVMAYADLLEAADGAAPQLARRSRCERATAHLLIDGQPQWVWVAAADVELISETR